MQLSQVSNAVQGQLSGADVSITGVTIDSRKDCTRQLFVALAGEHFDAHDFIGQAQLHGAAAAIIEKTVVTELPTVLVNDSHRALMELAGWWRAQFVIPVIGITGSVGKTSVKEMLGSIYAEIGCGLVTHGNLNNEIGVPLTLLRLSSEDAYAIVEMGMNRAGEISRLTQITKPTVTLINNATAAHLEGLGTINAVAKAKGEILDGLSEDGVAVINADDPYADLWNKLAVPRRVLTFGLCLDADVRASYKLTTTGLRMRVIAGKEVFNLKLPLLGKHNVMNALAAIAVAQASNIPIEAIVAGLINYRPVAGRLNVSTVGGITLIDDTYNANPASMRAAIEALAQFDESTLIVGDMAELGSASEQEHLQLGDFAKANGIDRLFAVGQFSEQMIRNFDGYAENFTDQSDLLAFLNEYAIDSGAVLVKGSRSSKMENIVAHFSRTQNENSDSNSRGRIV